MNQWDEAVRKAAEELIKFENLLNSEEMQAIITEHFADLRATYEELVELVQLYNRMDEIAFREDSQEEFNKSDRRVRELLSNPLVQAAIERSKG